MMVRRATREAQMVDLLDRILDKGMSLMFGLGVQRLGHRL